MTKVRMLTDLVIAEGPQRVLAGQELDLSDGMAQHVIETGAAVSVEQQALEIAADEPVLGAELHSGEESKEPTPPADDKPDENKVVGPSETKVVEPSESKDGDESADDNDDEPDTRKSRGSRARAKG